MAQTREDALLQFPRIVVASLEHVAAVVRLDHDRGATAQSFSNQRRDVTKIHNRRELYALVCGSKTEIIDGVVRNREWVKIDFADFEVFARFDLFHAITERFGAASWFFVTDVDFLTHVRVECFSGDVYGTIEGVQ